MVKSDLKRAVGGGGNHEELLKYFGGACFEMSRGKDAKRHSLLRFELFRKIKKILDLIKRNILISPLEGEKKFLGELCELSNKGRLGILAQREAGFEPSPAFVMLTEVRKRLLPLTKREGCDSVISNNFSDTVFSRFTSHFSRKCTAFTLAEVLITLGIIGIVSALTMPSLINSFRTKQLENQFKKVDSNLQQAIQKTVTEMGYDKITDFNSGGSDYFVTDTHKYISEFTEIFLKQFPDVKEYNCYLYFYKNLPCKTLTGGNEQNFTACCSPYHKTYILPNGFLFQEPFASSGEIDIYFDINGPYKGPNRTGHDRFTYSSKAYNNTADTGLYNMCNPNIQNSWNQSGCYRYATRNINPLDSSKPYWDILFKDAKYWKNSSN